MSGFNNLRNSGRGFDSHRPLHNPDDSVDLTRLSYLNSTKIGAFRSTPCISARKLLSKLRPGFMKATVEMCSVSNRNAFFLGLTYRFGTPTLVQHREKKKCLLRKRTSAHTLFVRA